jgi:hypothetical protein
VLRNLQMTTLCTGGEHLEGGHLTRGFTANVMNDRNIRPVAVAVPARLMRRQTSASS